MNYFQYVKLKDLMESYGYDNLQEFLNDESENSKVLNEIIAVAAIPLIAKIGLVAGAALLGLGVAFRKKLIGLGIKAIYVKQLKSHAAKFKKEAMTAILKSLEKFKAAKEEIKRSSKAKKFQTDGRLREDEKIITIEKQIINIFYQTINKLNDLKTKQIYSKIDSNKRLSDSNKYGLKFIWESLAADTRVELMAELMKTDYIESEKIKELLNNNIKEKEKINKEKFEQGLKTFKQKREAETKGKNFESFKEDVENEKNVEALKLLYQDIQKSEALTSEEKEELFKMLKVKGIVPKEKEYKTRGERGEEI